MKLNRLAEARDERLHQSNGPRDRAKLPGCRIIHEEGDMRVPRKRALRRIGVNGGAKVVHWAAQNQAT